jgi:hypothetical protein
MVERRRTFLREAMLAAETEKSLGLLANDT